MEMRTLDDYRGCFLFNANVLSHIRLRDLSLYLKNNRSITRVVTPEDYALDFYLLNHTHFELSNRFSPNEELPNEYRYFMNHYIDRNIDIFMRAFLYLLFITTKESRHILTPPYDSIGYSAERDFKDSIREQGYESCWHFTFSLKERKEKTRYAAKYAMLEYDRIPDVPLTKYIDYLYFLFEEGSFEDDDFGGITWRDITGVLRSFLHGEISAETFVDSMWTLSHNNGLIFDKSVVFSSYRDQNEMLGLLNAQAIGRIPEYITLYTPYTPSGKKTYNRVLRLFPEFFETNLQHHQLKKMIKDYSYSL